MYVKTMILFGESAAVTLVGDERKLANQLTGCVHGKDRFDSNIDGGRTRVDWRIRQNDDMFVIELKGWDNVQLETSWTRLGSGYTAEAALAQAIASPVLIGRRYSE